MALLSLFLLFAIWLYIFWTIGQGIRQWKARREYNKSLHPTKRRLRPFRRSVANEQPKRRILYRPPNKDR